ncbi:MAG: ribose-phosphate diphosphokinase, partial [Cytophagaceae bacterium]
KIPVDHLDSTYIFVPHIREQHIENLCLCSPDFGGLKRIKKYKNILGGEMAVISKERLKPNQISSMEIIGDVSGKNVVLVDDMIDTAGTLCKAAELIMQSGAASVCAYASHGIFSGKASENIDASPLKKIYVSDSVPFKAKSDKIEIVSTKELFAMAVDRLFGHKSLKDIYVEKNL